MIEERVNYALKNFFNLEKFRYTAGETSYNILEKSKKGKTRLLVNVGTSDSICFNEYDGFPKWEILIYKKDTGMRKCIDHFILKKNALGVLELHIFEMKTTIGFMTWENIQYKLRASYLSIKAIAVYLGISIQDENITVYTTYERDCFNITDMNNPMIVVPPVGSRAMDVKKHQWDGDFIHVPIIVSENNELHFLKFIKLRHKKSRMNRADDGFLEKTISLN